MDDRELVHVKQYHRNLMDISRQEQMLREMRPARSGNGFFLLRMLRSMFSLAHRSEIANPNVKTGKQTDLERETA